MNARSATVFILPNPSAVVQSCSTTIPTEYLFGADQIEFGCAAESGLSN